MQTWSKRDVRLLYATRTLCTTVPRREENQASFLPFLPPKNKFRHQQARTQVVLHATLERTILPSKAGLSVRAPTMARRYLYKMPAERHHFAGPALSNGRSCRICITLAYQLLFGLLAILRYATSGISLRSLRGIYGSATWYQSCC